MIVYIVSDNYSSWEPSPVYSIWDTRGKAIEEAARLNRFNLLGWGDSAEVIEVELNKASDESIL